MLLVIITLLVIVLPAYNVNRFGVVGRVLCLAPLEIALIFACWIVLGTIGALLGALAGAWILWGLR